MWAVNKTPKDWCESAIVLIYIFSCENHRKISLVSIASRLILGIVLRHLSSDSENQAGFCLDQSCVNKIFIPRKIEEQGHTSSEHTISFFCDLKAELRLIWSCSSAALPIMDECAREIHSGFLFFVLKRPNPRSSLRPSFTRVHRNRWYWPMLPASFVSTSLL